MTEPTNNSNLELRIDDLRGPEIAALLQEHLDAMAVHSPPGCVHALDLDALRSAEVTFWTAWQDSTLVGCGAIKELDATHGEIKSMRTATSHLRQGVAAAILHHIIHVANERRYNRLSLETGSGKPFAAAQAMYTKFGFTRCVPFADYADNSFTFCMTLVLDNQR